MAYIANNTCMQNAVSFVLNMKINKTQIIKINIKVNNNEIFS